MTHMNNWAKFKADFIPTTKQDGTYCIENSLDGIIGVPVTFDKGYQVSFERPDDTYTPDQFNVVVETLIAVCGRPYFGVWGQNKEISFHIYDLTFATKLGKFFGQEAIWDWMAKEAINL